MEYLRMKHSRVESEGKCKKKLKRIPCVSSGFLHGWGIQGRERERESLAKAVQRKEALVIYSIKLRKEEWGVVTVTAVRRDAREDDNWEWNYVKPYVAILIGGRDLGHSSCGPHISFVEHSFISFFFFFYESWDPLRLKSRVPDRSETQQIDLLIKIR